MKLILWTVTACCFTLGGIGWFGGAFAPTLFDNGKPDSMEFPLGVPEGIAVDSSGRIYCGLQFYNRIQQYDDHGKFITGWFIDSVGGAFRIRLNENDELEVATARNDMLYQFDQRGNLVKRYKIEDIFYDFGSENENSYHTSNGTLYRITRSLFSTSIDKQASSGEQKKVVTMSFRKWMLKAPSPAIYFLTIASLLVLSQCKVIRRKLYKKQKKEKWSYM